MSGSWHSSGSNVQSGASNKLVLGACAVLAVSSMGLKAANGTPHYFAWTGSAVTFEKRAKSILDRQGFHTSIEPRQFQSPIIHATRADCNLSVRDARGGVAVAVVFARDARRVGPLQYLYKGVRYEDAPAIQFRLGVFEANLLKWTGQAPPVHVPVAIARSPACGRGDFGLADVQLAS